MKKLIASSLATLFIVTSASSVLAASAKCTVKAIDENVVTLDCGKKAATLEVGSKVKIKSVKKKAIEGC
jgi:hypothetical protein